MNNSLVNECIKEFEKRYKLGVTSWMKLESINKKLSKKEQKYQAFLNFVDGRYESEQFSNSVKKIDKESIIVLFK